MERSKSLDSVRGIAVLMVFFIHLSQKTLPIESPAFSIAKLGSMGVQLFFLISAVTILMSFNKHKAIDKKPIRSFFVRRSMRIIPIYWLGIVIYTLLFGVLASRGWGDGPEAWHYPWHFALMSMLHPETQSTVVPGGWSISVEIQFYLLCPLIFMTIKNLQTATYFLLVTTIFALVYRLVFSDILYANELMPLLGESPERNRYKFLYRSLPSQMPVFACGVCLYFIKDSHRLTGFVNSNTFSLWGVFFSLIFIYIIITINGGTLARALETYAHIYFAFTLAIPVAIALYRPSSIPTFHALQQTGRASYSFYLLHFLVLNSATEALADRLNNYQFFVTLITTLPITYFLSQLMAITIEAKINRMTKGMIKKLNNKPEHAPLSTH
ncbi:acyltransferase family protein [Aliagarivorans taiwanensis]|uniref:acyltransferase family protein n=1 Tax=Aliagarivorans taiwanensis TaxID=561966 RepID=UPI000408615E|nr:acyltransferase [Aliagarivorans taiwanensis]